jgi:putative transposase
VARLSQRLVNFNVTEHSTAEWTLQQLRETLPGDEDCKFLLHGRHNTFSASLDDAVESWGIHVLKSPVHMPTANAHCERLIGTIRRECLDYFIPLNDYHFRRTLREWTCHYNTARHISPSDRGSPGALQETPPSRRQPDRLCRASQVIAKPILAGLHHEYRWETAA